MRLFLSTVFSSLAVMAGTTCVLGTIAALEQKPSQLAQYMGMISVVSAMLTVVFVYLSALLGYETEGRK